MGCPSPLAQWQVGLPQRRWQRESEPGRASSGICSERSAAYFRCRRLEASCPLGSIFICVPQYLQKIRCSTANSDRENSAARIGNLTAPEPLQLNCLPRQRSLGLAERLDVD